MADNRMYLRCNLCGKAFYLAKFSGGGWWHQQAGEPEAATFLDEFNEWLGTHDDHGYGAGGHAHERAFFDVVYEAGPEHRPEQGLRYVPVDADGERGWPWGDDEETLT